MGASVYSGFEHRFGDAVPSLDEYLKFATKKARFARTDISLNPPKFQTIR
jgi:hypothetical protein